MTLRIEPSEREGFTVFILSGRLDVEYIGELRRLFGPLHDYPKTILDLNEVKSVDRKGVRFLGYCESHGLRLDNCPQYIREWMEKEAESAPFNDADGLIRDKEQN
jgi:hypothetical protein